MVLSVHLFNLTQLQCDDELFLSIRKDIRAQFIEHQSFVHVATTVELSHPLIRPAITFLIASDKRRKVTQTGDIFLSAQKIDARFRQTAEEIQNALPLTNNDGIRYWYQLDVLQNIVRNGEILLDGRSAGAALGWLIYVLENINLQTPILSILGVYDAFRKQFRPVDALEEKLDACVEDGIRIIAVPQATLEKRIRPGTSFKDYAKERKVHLIAFPDDMPILKVYSFIFEKYQALGIEPITEKPKDVEDPSYRHTSNQRGELLQDGVGTIYWVQDKKHYIPNFDVINHMRYHEMPGWRSHRKVDVISKVQGPPFYFTDSRSNGLLIKFYKEPPVFLIDNAQKQYLSDEYSYENYRYQGRLLEWGDIISVTEDILRKFPTAEKTTQSTPCLSSPANGSTIEKFPVTLCGKPHQNKTWEYHFQIANKQDFSAPVCEEVVSSPSLVISTLTQGEYWWRVRGVKHGRQPSDWSEAWSFKMAGCQ